MNINCFSMKLLQLLSILFQFFFTCDKLAKQIHTNIIHKSCFRSAVKILLCFFFAFLSIILKTFYFWTWLQPNLLVEFLNYRSQFCTFTKYTKSNRIQLSVTIFLVMCLAFSTVWPIIAPIQQGKFVKPLLSHTHTQQMPQKCDSLNGKKSPSKMHAS